MQSQQAQERRKHPRRETTLVVAYRPELSGAVYDITHTQNVSQGGMLLTTASIFSAGTRLAIQARLTFRDSPALMQGRTEVLGYRELVPNLLYEIRVRFLELDRWALRTIGDFCAGETDPAAATGRLGKSGRTGRFILFPVIRLNH